MRLYEFKKTATDPKDNIDVVVVTDGIDGQKRVFVTETPRGISVPGDQTPTPPNPNNKILILKQVSCMSILTFCSSPLIMVFN